MKPHKHAELIKAWADGAEIQSRYKFGYGDWTDWTDNEYPVWEDEWEYRIKPEPKPDIKWLTVIDWDFEHNQPCIFTNGDFNLEIVFDGETGELKSAEVLK